MDLRTDRSIYIYIYITCLKEIDLHARLTILGSIVNMIGGDLYDYPRKRVYTLVKNNIFR